MNDRETVRRMLVQQLEALRGFGVQQLGVLPAVQVVERSPPPVTPPVATTTAPSSSPSASRPSRAQTSFVAHEPHDMPRKSAAAPAPVAGSGLLQLPYTSPCLNRNERLALFGDMKKEVAGCLACQELVRNRRQTVFGVGNVSPRVVFFGEAPGQDEDKQGEPFVGRAGNKLNEIIKACTFQREDVYILNVLKCRPPDNRPPMPQETANCRHYFERQLDALQPEYIVCLGASAAQALLETTESIGKLRGRFFQYRGSKVVATYHPSYLLRNPPASRYVWDDMKMMLRDMGIEPPAGKQSTV